MSKKHTLSDKNSWKFPSFFLSNKFFQNAISRKVSDTLHLFLLWVTRGAHNPNLQVPVVLKVDNAIHRINQYPVDSAIGFPDSLIRWMVIYPVDSIIQLLNDWGQVVIMHALQVCSQHSFGTCTKNEWNAQNAIWSRV